MSSNLEFSKLLETLSKVNLDHFSLILDEKEQIQIVPNASLSKTPEEQIQDLEKVAKAINKQAWQNFKIFKNPANIGKLLLLEARISDHITLSLIQSASEMKEGGRVVKESKKMDGDLIYAAKKIYRLSTRKILSASQEADAREHFGFLDLKSKKGTLLEIFDEYDLFSTLELELEHYISLLTDNPSLSEEDLEYFSDLINQLAPEGLNSLLEKAAEKKCANLVGHILKINKINKTEILKTLLVNQFEPETILGIGQKIGDTHLLADFVDCSAQHILRGPADHLLFDRFNPKAFQRFKYLYTMGYPIRPVTITQLFLSQNYQAIQFVFQNATEDWIKTNAEHILNQVLKSEDPKIHEILLKTCPQIYSFCSYKLLKRAVKHGHVQFVEQTLKNGAILTSAEIKQLFQLAEESLHLMLIEILSKYISENNIAESKFPVIDKLNQLTDEEELLQVAANFAITSPLAYLYQLLPLCPNLCKVLPEVLQLTSLLVRFPHLRFAAEVNAKWLKTSEYVSDSIEYARKNHTFLKELLTIAVSMKRNDLLDAITQNRFQRMTQKDKNYITKQIDEPKSCITPLITSTGKTVNSSVFKTFLYYSRYAWSFRHFAALNFDWKNYEWEKMDTPSCVLRDSEISYFYPLSPDENLPTTRLTNRYTMWEHTYSSTISKLQEHLESLHSQILNYDLDVSDASNKKEFFEKVARGYWLIATLCETHRGTPHNAMMWLNLIYAHHNLPSPIPKMPFFYLDNLALMIPVEIMIKDWPTFFELPLDQNLPDTSDKEATVQVLLETNGLLLRECSEEVRGNKNLVAAAVRQNPEAMKFASKSLQKDPELIALSSI